MTSKFAEGARQTSNLPTVSLELSRMNPDTIRQAQGLMMRSGLGPFLISADEPGPQKDLVERIAREVKQQFKDQGIPIHPQWTDKDFARLALAAIERGPYAQNNHINGQDVCIAVNAHYDHMRIIESALPIGMGIKPLPGKPENYLRLIGRHEGGHCAEDSNIRNGKTATLAELTSEVVADGAAVKGEMSVEATAILQNRVLSFVLNDNKSTSHATGFFIDEKGQTTLPTRQSIANLKNLKDDMIRTVAAGIGGNEAAAENLLKKQPHVFAQILKDRLEEGKLPAGIDNEQKGFMQRFVAAVDARIDPELVPAPQPVTAPAAETQAKAQMPSMQELLGGTQIMVQGGGGSMAAKALASTGDTTTAMKVVGDEAKKPDDAAVATQQVAATQSQESKTRIVTADSMMRA